MSAPCWFSVEHYISSFRQTDIGGVGAEVYPGDEYKSRLYESNWIISNSVFLNEMKGDDGRCSSAQF